VRVLYNQQPLELPGCPPDKLMGLSTFEKELLGSFILSEQDHAQVCESRERVSGGGRGVRAGAWIDAHAVSPGGGFS
jgi:hypothetical protein